MTITEYNSKNSATLEFKWIPFKKRNNLDELINIPTKAEERSMMQILFRTQDPNISQAQSEIRVKNFSSSTIHCVFKIRQSTRFTEQNPQSMREGAIARLIWKSDETEAWGRFEITSTITPWIARHEVQLQFNRIYNKFKN